MSNRTAVEISRDFWILKRWQPPPSGIFKFLTVGHVKKVKLCHRAKFCLNRMKRGRDMVIFRKSKMAAAAMLDFRNFKFVTVGHVKRVELLPCAKFR